MNDSTKYVYVILIDGQYDTERKNKKDAVEMAKRLARATGKRTEVRKVKVLHSS